MLSGKDIVCFSTDWGGHVDSSHHLMRRLMRENRVLWVNSTGLRRPTLSAYDLRRMWQKVFVRGGQSGSADVASGPVAICSPRVLPLYGSRMANAVNRHMLGRGVARLMRETGMHDVIVWASLPTAELALGAVKPALVVNYVMDDYTVMPGVNRAAIEKLERRLFERSDVVLVTAEHLKEVKSVYGKPILVLPHGVEFEHFAGPRPEMPAELAGVRRPIVGFFGLVAPWIDVEMIAEVAGSNPEFSFVFVGDVQTDVGALAGLGNVRMIPKVPYARLPAYARQFDVSTLPFRIDELTLNVNPLKLMEYFAVGAPVVSTRLPAVEAYVPHVRIADTAEEFSAAVRAAVTEETEGARWARMEIARVNSWDSRAETVSAVIEEALLRKQGV